jgi:hypothetical protein
VTIAVRVAVVVDRAPGLEFWVTEVVVAGGVGGVAVSFCTVVAEAEPRVEQPVKTRPEKATSSR